MKVTNKIRKYYRALPLVVIVFSVLLVTGGAYALVRYRATVAGQIQIIYTDNPYEIELWSDQALTDPLTSIEWTVSFIEDDPSEPETRETHWVGFWITAPNRPDGTDFQVYMMPLDLESDYALEQEFWNVGASRWEPASYAEMNDAAAVSGRLIRFKVTGISQNGAMPILCNVVFESDIPG